MFKKGNKRQGRSKLESSPLMLHLLEALDAGEDIRDYGRLTFIMVARHFLDDEEIVRLLADQPGIDRVQAESLVSEINRVGYNPPTQEMILEWQSYQEFPFYPDVLSPEDYDIFESLAFPDEVYETLAAYESERPEPQLAPN